MKEEVMAITAITIGLLTFEIINLVGVKQTGTTPALLRYTLLTGIFQIGAYFVFVWGLNHGYTAFSDNIWMLTLVQLSVSYFVKIGVRSALFHQPLAKGNLAGMIFAVVGALIAKFWR